MIIAGYDAAVGKFMAARLDQPNAFHAESGRGLGLADNGRLIAGVWYENHNGPNMMVHIAAEPGHNWLLKEYLWYMHFYPFIECNCKRITALIAASNETSVNFVQRLGFEHEATLHEAAVDGDLLVYVMFRDKCKWLKLRDRIRKVN